MKRFLIGYCLLTTCLLFMQREAQKPLLVYHADSKYQITGKVTEKRKMGTSMKIRNFWRWIMRIKTDNGSIINVNNIKRSITIEGIELGSDCQALVSKHQDGTGTITLVFDGKVI